MVNSELLLAFAIVGVYLFDSARFLSIGDVVVSTRRERARHVSFGLSFELGGRRPYLPNPLTPFWPELCIQWTSGSPADMVKADVATSEMVDLLKRTRPISRLATLAGLFIVMVAPVVLTVGNPMLFIVAVGISYLFAVAACCTLGARRKSLQLSWSQTISMIVTALLCLPCATNLGRAVLRHRCWTLAASEVPALGFDPSEDDEIRYRVSAFLSQVRRLFPEDTAEYSALTSQIGLLERTRRGSR